MKETQSAQAIILYGSPTCPQVRPCRGLLQRAEAAFTYVDIYKDGDGRQMVRTINDGYESVPTLVFPDGSTLTEPSSAALKAKLEEMGYVIRRPKPWESIKERPFLIMLAMLALLFGFNDSSNVFLIISLILFAIVFLGGWLRGY